MCETALLDAAGKASVATWQRAPLGFRGSKNCSSVAKPRLSHPSKLSAGLLCQCRRVETPASVAHRETYHPSDSASDAFYPCLCQFAGSEVPSQLTQGHGLLTVRLEQRFVAKTRLRMSPCHSQRWEDLEKSWRSVYLPPRP